MPKLKAPTKDPKITDLKKFGGDTGIQYILPTLDKWGGDI